MKYRIFARYETGFHTVGYSSTYAGAVRRADAYMLSLNPDEDECPEMEIEVVRR